MATHRAKENWVYSGYGIPIDSAGWLNFDNDFRRNAAIVGADRSSLSDTDNRQ